MSVPDSRRGRAVGAWEAEVRRLEAGDGDEECFETTEDAEKGEQFVRNKVGSHSEGQRPAEVENCRESPAASRR